MRTIIAATALLILAGCGGPAPVPAPEANAADAEPELAPPVDEAAAAALRELLPVYPGATRLRDGRAEGAGSGSIAFATSDPTRPVIDFYAAAARRAGFEVEIHPPTGITLSMTATRAGGGLVNVITNRVGNVTEVQAMAAVGARAE